MELQVMDRTRILDLMGELKLFGMRGAFDEVMTSALKRQHEPQRIVGELLKAEIAEKQARSIKYQLTIAKLPLAKDVADFEFEDTPINRGSCATSPPAASSRSSATSSWSVAPEPARRTWRSPLPEAVSGPAPEDASSTSSIW